MAGRFEQRPTRTTMRGGRAGVPSPRPAPDTLIGTGTGTGTGTGAGLGGRTRSWVPPWPLDLRLVLGPLRRGPADPTFRATPDGSVWRASLTPVGPGTLRVSACAGVVHGEAWGPGAEWLLDRLPRMLGEADDPGAFEPRHRLVAMSRHRRPGLRLTCTGLVLESLIPSILEQKVTVDEAYRAWRALVRRYGMPAPGPPAGGGGMFVMPEPRVWSLIPSWEWHRAGVDNKRASTILRAVRVARRMEEAVALDVPAARERLEKVPGIGPWTSAETVQRSHGAADAVTVGDLNLPGIIGYALAGNRDADDTVMLELLEPYAGQRHRAARLILLSGRTPPRRHPKRSRGDIGRL
ncbi:DNA-3-methyladenine glycosylase family protein [Streptomyces beigongshangae]|uniref:DNA-3-methyladenine glycosylase family protein n=1 Tax=Streptomyces beigongshangae TaxID=2841597 RepID=UPI001C85CFBE|nr:DNA-3-methyladenine glycosylase 2 family protein [Streptomyces sp. REN17]